MSSSKIYSKFLLLSIVYCTPIDVRDHTSKLLDLEDKLSASFQGCNQGWAQPRLYPTVIIDQYTLI